ncbi:MAG: type II toxin-antitoxin system RelE/ParE family toxin [Pseudomonadota bacterium]
MKVEFHPEARLELLNSVSHYSEIQPALGERFLESVTSSLQSISENPELGAEIERGIRRKLTRVFPYALLYVVESERILILAVLHCHQRPGYWRSRLARG